MEREALRARAERLLALAEGLGKELALWRGKEPVVLTPAERREYLREVQNAVAGGIRLRPVNRRPRVAPARRWHRLLLTASPAEDQSQEQAEQLAFGEPPPYRQPGIKS